MPEAENIGLYDVDNGRIVWSEALVEEHVYAYRPGYAGETVSHVFNVPDDRDITSLQVHGDRLAIALESAGGESDALVIDLRTRLPLWANQIPLNHYSPVVFDRRDCDGCGCRRPEVRRVCGGWYCLVCQPWTAAEVREIRADERLHDGR